MKRMNKMLNNSLFSSKTEEWATPQHLYDMLNIEFCFNLDVCATYENAKHENYYTKEQDALSKKWEGICFMNPPYGRRIKDWIKKAYESALAGATVVCLLPARTDTSWWHDYCATSEDIRFIRGRLKFGDSKNSAPFPSVIVVFKKNNIKRR